MILVVGGAFQGKKEFAKELAAGKKLQVVNFFIIRSRNFWRTGRMSGITSTIF